MTISHIADDQEFGNHSDQEYNDYLDRLQVRFLKNTLNNEPLFTTSAQDLFNVYLASLPAPVRQYHNCNACRRFIERYGGLVTISEDGKMTPAFWDEADAPSMYRLGVHNMIHAVKNAHVTGVFHDSSLVWGHPETGAWTHLSLVSPRPFKHPLLTAGQMMAEQQQDYITLSRAIADFNIFELQSAVDLLQTNALYRSEKVLGVAEWLLDLRARLKQRTSVRRNNIIWRAVATAPAGYCHPRSSMIGTLLEDITSGLNTAEVGRRFAAKMQPDLYQRPQAPPKAGNIQAAEKIIDKLGVARSLERRFAQLEEVQTIWKPRAVRGQPQRTSGVFSHLQPARTGSTPHLRQTGTTVITWEKFRRTVMPMANKIEFLVPSTLAAYCAVLTAVHADAPLIFQWDNPFSWYVYKGGSAASNWRLTTHTFAEVTGIMLQPSMWNGGMDHQGRGVLFILKGAKDVRYRTAGNGLFPEILRSEMHAIRSTIEAHSDSQIIKGFDAASACGIMLGNGTYAYQFRVTMNGLVASYTIDRFD